MDAVAINFLCTLSELDRVTLLFDLIEDAHKTGLSVAGALTLDTLNALIYISKILAERTQNAFTENKFDDDQDTENQFNDADKFDDAGQETDNQFDDAGQFDDTGQETEGQFDDADQFDDAGQETEGQFDDAD